MTSPRQMRFESSYTGERPVPALVMDFDLQLCHATLLGLMNDDGSVRLPGAASPARSWHVSHHFQRPSGT